MLDRKKFWARQGQARDHFVMVGLYYGLHVEYASLLWEEFGTSISHTKLATKVSSARFGG